LIVYPELVKSIDKQSLKASPKNMDVAKEYKFYARLKFKGDGYLWLTQAGSELIIAKIECPSVITMAPDPT
jgi:hypothetical protein